MKKLLIISSFLIIILAFSMVGYKIVSANDEVDEIKDSIKEQENIFKEAINQIILHKK